MHLPLLHLHLSNDIDVGHVLQFQLLYFLLILFGLFVQVILHIVHVRLAHLSLRLLSLDVGLHWHCLNQLLQVFLKVIHFDQEVVILLHYFGS